MLRLLVTWGYVPLMLIAGNGIAIAWIAHGLPALALLPWLLVAVAASFAAERLAPHDPQQHAPRGERWRDTAHAVVNETMSFGGVAIIPLLSALSPWGDRWPAHWHLGWQWLLAVLVADAGITLMHWASHRVGWLWRLHAVHHSVPRLYGLNGLMKHPLHQLVETAAGVMPLLVMGLPQGVAALLAYSVALQLLLQHANVDIRLGPLRHVLAVAPVHRFHHRKWAGIGDVNFGLFTTLWDRLLGTTVDDPAHRFTAGEFGIGTQPDYPQRYLAQLCEPFIAAANNSRRTSP